MSLFLKGVKTPKNVIFFQILDIYIGGKKSTKYGIYPQNTFRC
jgi:hypothetical protein